MKLKRWLQPVALGAATAAIAAFFLLHFLHPSADFPNFSPWMDYAKYTDEGWYGNAASSYFIRGAWYVPGDFNPAVALPVWPLLEWALFHFTGVSLAAARVLAIAIFGGNLALAYALLRSQAPRWAAMLAVAVLVSNAFLYCFSRLAILEPLMIFLMLLSWLVALRLSQPRRAWQRNLLAAVVGLLLCAMVLTKTTAAFLLPSVIYLVCLGGARAQRRKAFPRVGIVALSAAIPWLAYYCLAVRPRYLADYRYLFTANVYPQPTTASGWLMAFWYALHGALWIDPKFVILTAALLLSSLVWFRGLWRNPLFGAACLACAGYLLFIGYHDNMQPRYYQVLAFPLAIMATLALHGLVQRRGALPSAAATLGAAALAFTMFVNARETLWFAFHPQYSFVDAAKDLTRYIDRHPNRNRLLLSISGSNITLVTGLPAICDDFGTLDLPARIRLYQPGWYAAWNEIDPETLADIQTQFELKQVASFHAYDDEDRDNLILYRLVPLAPPAPNNQARQPAPGPLDGAAERPASIRDGA